MGSLFISVVSGLLCFLFLVSVVARTLWSFVVLKCYLEPDSGSRMVHDHAFGVHKAFGSGAAIEAEILHAVFNCIRVEDAAV